MCGNPDKVHKITILNLPKVIAEPSSEKQNVNEAKGCRPTEAGSPTRNHPEELRRELRHTGLHLCVLGHALAQWRWMQNPGIKEDDIICHMQVLNPQSCRSLLNMMVLDNDILCVVCRQGCLSFMNPTSSAAPLSFIELKAALFHGFQSFNQLKHIHARLIRTGFDQNNYLLNLLLKFTLNNFNNPNYAKLVFNQSQEPNIFLYNTMIRGLVSNDCFHQAIDFFHSMREEGVDFFEDYHQVFDDSEKNVVSWTASNDGTLILGSLRKLLTVSRSLEMGLSPDSFTLVAKKVVTCSRVGMLVLSRARSPLDALADRYARSATPLELAGIAVTLVRPGSRKNASDLCYAGVETMELSPLLE
ncbi:hypothetical protein HAX54_017713 [Datura stramonium]|uniref:Pentatricopeptide repeat-containing protein n=1 Tax=Datura stramonium TaxID=4076 RepID=A0ABS8S1F9_DATST|nr:hypothetical protein [Datura stramonium]